jgi:type IV secretory pathway component VirB8
MMDGGTLPEGMAPRGEGLRSAQRAMAYADSMERERRIRRLITIGGGWAVAAMMTAVAGASLAVMWARPVPQDRPFVVVAHDDGTFSPALVRDDLAPGQKAMLFRNTVEQYVKARENYTWEGVNSLYMKVSAMSAPSERARYQAIMLDPKNAENPGVLFGSGINAASADVISIVVRPDANAPYSVSASFVLKVVPPNMAPRYFRKTATMTWMDARDTIPPGVQQQYDPAGIAFAHYASNIDPEAPK